MEQDPVEFTAVDVETTGLFPNGTDRILEIAMLRVAPDGSVLDEYATLVNPRRDVGPTHLHGIHAGDVLGAPSFEDVAGDVIQRLAGAVFVAHNASFDARFLRAEMLRAGHELPDFPQLCTLRLSRLVDPYASSRRLQDLCLDFDVNPGEAHTARDDARAASALLAACLRQLDVPVSRVLERLCGTTRVPARSTWPAIGPSGLSYHRSDAARRRRQSDGYIADLVGRLPVGGGSGADTLEYAALLDRVLEDRRVTEEERAALAALAEDIGLTRDQARTANERYLLDLLYVALEDGVITAAEESDLREVQRLLGIDDETYASLEARAREQPAASNGHHGGESLAGVTVCFTGTLNCSIGGQLATRSMAQGRATDAGMVVKGGVSKKLGMLVLADPDSMSGKARRARELGVRLVAEPVFWRMVGVTVQ